MKWALAGMLGIILSGATFAQDTATAPLWPTARKPTPPPAPAHEPPSLAPPTLAPPSAKPRPSTQPLFKSARTAAAKIPGKAPATQPPRVTPNTIQQSIVRASEFLAARQADDGSWGPAGENSANGVTIDPDGGRTALITLALLTAGHNPQSPAINKALVYLRQKQMNQPYAVGLRLCVYSMVPARVTRKEIVTDVGWLKGMINQTGPLAGFYDYGISEVAGGDLSGSYFAELGLFAANEAGVDATDGYWQRAEKAWLTAQKPDGGWSNKAERSGIDSYASMTVAGLSALYFTHDILHFTDAKILPSREDYPKMHAAVKWIDENFSPSSNAGVGDAGFFQMLYTAERIGESSGKTRFGTRVWFDEGAKTLLEKQAKDGSWTGNIDPAVDTAFALMFLARGHAPVPIQKWIVNDSWKNRSRDIANFARWCDRTTHRHVNWQIVSGDATLAQMRQSPILYAASDRPARLDDSQKKTLKEYLNRGGLLVCAQDGAGDAFARAIVEVGKELYPQYEFRELTPDHPIFHQSVEVKNYSHSIGAMSNGVRELIVILPENDVSWQLHLFGSGRAQPAEEFKLLANLYAYAIGGRNPGWKGEDNWIERTAAVARAPAIDIARVKYSGSWNPEPASWTRFSNFIHNHDHADLSTHTATLGQNELRADTKLAHFTAPANFGMTPDEAKDLKTFIDGGGIIFFDAAGGSAVATGAFQNAIASLYPTAQILPIPETHPIYRGASIGGADIRAATFRAPGRNGAIAMAPRLKGAFLAGRLVAIISPEDLTCALAGIKTAGITGYTTPSATEITRNIILWTSSQKYATIRGD